MARTSETGVLRESFCWNGSSVQHEIGSGIRAHTDAVPHRETAPKNAWWANYLTGSRPRALSSSGRTVRVVDLFSGAGGLALGLRQLLDEMGAGARWELIVDRDPGATAVYARNNEVARISNESVAGLVDYRVRRRRESVTFAYPPEFLDVELGASVAGVDLVMAGPPCEGHSNLNNRTRRDDPRNFLYLAVPAFVVAARARMVVIENVPAIRHDHGGVLEDTVQLLASEGYHVETGVLSADAMGWPQTRKRLFVVARKGDAPVPLNVVQSALAEPKPLDLRWAIGDMGERPDDPLHRSGNLSPANQSRIAWLFDNDEHDLGLSERPECHRDGTSYSAVYGRLHWDRPAPTITTGFLTPGRGRFVHPGERRTLTPREAARLQGFPDTYRFAGGAEHPSRGELAKWIGDAVPMPLGYAAALSVFAPDFPRTIP